MMGTVYKRTFRSTPHRDALETWSEITDLLTRSNQGARTELEAVAGIVSSTIADQSPSGSPIIVSCEGPQTRVFCLYNDDAIDGSDGNEDVLGYDPLKGDWSISIPCEAEDLDWVSGALAGKSDRITARDRAEKRQETAKAEAGGALEIDMEGLMKP